MNETQPADAKLGDHEKALIIVSGNVFLALIVAITFLAVAGSNHSVLNAFLLFESVVGILYIILGVGHHLPAVFRKAAWILRGKRGTQPGDSGGPITGWLWPVVLANFGGLWYLICETGGPVVSPFAQFAFTMVVMGQLLASEKWTLPKIFGVGVVFFGLLTILAPASNSALAGHVSVWVYYAVTFVNLMVSTLVNYVSRTWGET